MPNIPQLPSVVLDIGTSSTKVGLSDMGEPSLIFPTVVGRAKHRGAMLRLGLRDTYIGYQAQALRGILNIHNPMKVVPEWQHIERLCEYIWQDIDVLGDVTEYNVLASLPPLLSKKDRNAFLEILLETVGVNGVYLANKSVLSMYGGGRTTGIAIDSGEDRTFIVPCWEGTSLSDATSVLELGGRHITDRLLHQLSKGKYSFTDDTFLLKKNNNRNKFTVASRQDVVREAKERFCRFRPFSRDHQSTSTVEDEHVLRLPDGNIIIVCDEAYSAPEIMFQSDQKQKLITDSGGLHEMIYSSIMRCDVELRPRLLSNIMIAGGNSLIGGLSVRLQNELRNMLPTNLSKNVRVVGLKGRQLFTWTGGAHLCSLSSFQRLWGTKQNHDETGFMLGFENNCETKSKDLSQNEIVG